MDLNKFKKKFKECITIILDNYMTVGYALQLCGWMHSLDEITAYVTVESAEDKLKEAMVQFVHKFDKAANPDDLDYITNFIILKLETVIVLGQLWSKMSKDKKLLDLYYQGNMGCAVISQAGEKVTGFELNFAYNDDLSMEPDFSIQLVCKTDAYKHLKNQPIYAEIKNRMFYGNGGKTVEAMSFNLADTAIAIKSLLSSAIKKR